MTDRGQVERLRPSALVAALFVLIITVGVVVVAPSAVSVVGDWGADGSSRDGTPPGALRFTDRGIVTGSDACGIVEGQWLSSSFGTVDLTLRATSPVCEGGTRWVSSVRHGVVADGRLLLYDERGVIVGSFDRWFGGGSAE